MRGLNDKRRLFVEEFLKDLNATQAAIRAGYSPKTARQQGARLLSDADVCSALADAKHKRIERVRVEADDVLREILKLATSDVRRLFDDAGRLLPPHQLPDEVAAAVSSIEVVTSRVPGSDPVELEYTTKIKFWDKKGSLELLGKHLKLFNDAPSQAVTQVTVYLPDNAR